MRIRTIKPEFWSDEDLITVSDKARLLAIALLNYADDEGYFRANPKLIRAALFPLSPSVKSTVLLRELSSIGYIELCTGTDGKQYGRLPTFLIHQVINKSKPSRIKGLWGVPDEYGIDTVSVPPGTGNREQGKEQGTGKALCAEFDKFWKGVPNKLGKGDARTAYMKAIKNGATPEEIIGGVATYIAYEAKRSRQPDYRPLHPSTWLNGERWNDELPRQAKQESEAQNQEDMAASVKAEQEKAYGRGVVR